MWRVLRPTQRFRGSVLFGRIRFEACPYLHGSCGGEALAIGSCRPSGRFSYRKIAVLPTVPRAVIGGFKRSKVQM
jgi:hypothetical protein